MQCRCLTTSIEWAGRTDRQTGSWQEDGEKRLYWWCVIDGAPQCFKRITSSKWIGYVFVCGFFQFGYIRSSIDFWFLGVVCISFHDKWWSLISAKAWNFVGFFFALCAVEGNRQRLTNEFFLYIYLWNVTSSSLSGLLRWDEEKKTKKYFSFRLFFVSHWSLQQYQIWSYDHLFPLILALVPFS